MTDTLSTRLRNRAYRLATRDFNGDGANLAIEAAKRIEALESSLRDAERLLVGQASQVGSLHAWWDTIFDIRAVLEGK